MGDSDWAQTSGKAHSCDLGTALRGRRHVRACMPGDRYGRGAGDIARAVRHGSGRRSVSLHHVGRRWSGLQLAALAGPPRWGRGTALDAGQDATPVTGAVAGASSAGLCVELAAGGPCDRRPAMARWSISTAAQLEHVESARVYRRILLG